MKLLLLISALFFTSLANAQWKQTHGVYGVGVTCFAVNGNNIFAGTGSGLFLSSNNGDSWTLIDSSLTTRKNVVGTALAVSGNNIFMGNGGVYLSANGGSSWISVDSGLTNKSVSSLAINGNSIFAGTSTGVFFSNNNGTTWTHVDSILTKKGVQSFAISGNNIFVGTNGAGVCLSSNNGTTWASVDSGLPNNSSIWRLAINGNNIYAGTTSNQGLFLSTNNGSTWSAINNGQVFTPVLSIAVSGPNLFWGTNFDGVLYSNNNGSSWISINEGLAGDYITALVICGPYIFAGTSGDGVWRRPLSEIILGVKENTNAASAFKIYPNPVTDKLNIENPGIKSKQAFEVFDMMGQSLYRDDFSEKTKIDLSDFPQGLYFVKLFSENSETIKKFVKQ